VLLAADVSCAFKCYLFPYCVQSCFSVDVIAGCSTLTGFTVVHYVLFSFRIEGRQATKIQDNSKDQFEIDSITLLTHFDLFSGPLLA